MSARASSQFLKRLSISPTPTACWGRHVFTAMALSGEGAPARWTVVTMPPEHARVKRAEPTRRGKRAERGKVVEIAVADPRPTTTAAEALDRVSMPNDAADRISELMSVGASLVISDQGLGPETGLETDFVVLIAVSRRREPYPSGPV